MSSKTLVPDAIAKAALYPPGRPLDEIIREYGIQDLVKLNANENSLGPSPKAVEAIRESALCVHRYPDNSAYYLKKRLAAMHALAPDNIILGNGSNELVQFIFMTFLGSSEEVVTGLPTFLLYRIMGRVLGGVVSEVPLRDHRYDLPAMAARLTDATKLVLISNPNNPTGTIVTDDELERFLEAVPRDVLVVLDEAYAEYVTSSRFPESSAYVRDGRNVLVLRTFSKAYGLAGVRLGYALAPRELIGYLERVREPFNANSLAQTGALAALDDRDHLNRTIENNRAGLAYLSQQLERLRIAYVPSQTNFLLIFTALDSGVMTERLLREGVMVRDMSGFGLENRLRVTVGLPEENRRFIEALERLLPA